MAQLDEKLLAKWKKKLLKQGVDEEKIDAAFDELKDEDEEKESETEEQVEEAKEDVAEKGEDEQSEKDRVDESVGEQEKLDGDEDSQDAKDRVDESEGEEKHDDKEEDAKQIEEAVEEHEAEDYEEKENLKATVDALVSRLTALEEKLNSVVDKLDDKPFGEKPQSVSKEDDYASEDAIMRSYNPAYRR